MKLPIVRRPRTTRRGRNAIGGHEKGISRQNTQSGCKSNKRQFCREKVIDSATGRCKVETEVPCSQVSVMVECAKASAAIGVDWHKGNAVGSSQGLETRQLFLSCCFCCGTRAGRGCECKGESARRGANNQGARRQVPRRTRAQAVCALTQSRPGGSVGLASAGQSCALVGPACPETEV